MINGKPNPPNMRRRRYSRWLDKAAKLLMETNEAKTTQQLLNELPDDRHTPANVGSASQKLRKDKRFAHYMDKVHDFRGQNYEVAFWYFVGEYDEE